MNINYEKIQKSINEYGQYILSCIKNEYGPSLTQEQLQNIDNLLNTELIVVEKPSNADIEFFSKLEGIDNPDDYSIDYIPSAHGGRTKADNKIHIYPYTKTFSNCNSDEEIIKSCIDNIVVHEIFHYFIRPNLSLDNKTVKDEFGHFLTEGLVQYYAEKFAKEHRLGNPKSNYLKNVEFAEKLVSSFPSDLPKAVKDNIVFTYNQDELLKVAQNGQELYQEYRDDLQFQKDIAVFITDLGLNIDASKEELNGIIRHFSKVDNPDIVFGELSKNIEMIFKDNVNLKENYRRRLKNIIFDRKLKSEITKYEMQMKSFLPLEEKVNKLRESGMSEEEIKTKLSINSSILEHVPDTLYYGSSESLDVTNANGSYVYATDNPIHALFSSVFRNSSVARANINEYIDENGNYKVKYQIDERIKGALDEIITDKDITVNVCNGAEFFKPQGATYTSREWISKEWQSIVPTDKIQVNIKHFFENLEHQGLVEYSRYDKSKDWKTVIDTLGQNCPFGLSTIGGNNIQEFDLMYDEFMRTNFPEQFEFSKQFRLFTKEVMANDYKLGNPQMSLEEENNYKLRYLKNTADSFLLPQKDEKGKINWNVDIDKVNEFMNQTNTLQEEKGKSL